MEYTEKKKLRKNGERKTGKVERSLRERGTPRKPARFVHRNVRLFVIRESRKTTSDMIQIMVMNVRDTIKRESPGKK